MEAAPAVAEQSNLPRSRRKPPLRYPAQRRLVLKPEIARQSPELTSSPVHQKPKGAKAVIEYDHHAVIAHKVRAVVQDATAISLVEVATMQKHHDGAQCAGRGRWRGREHVEKRQDSDIFVEYDGWERTVLRTGGAVSKHILVPFHAIAGCGSCQRSAPVGGAAYGMPRKAATPSDTAPRTAPLSVCTTTFSGFAAAVTLNP